MGHRLRSVVLAMLAACLALAIVAPVASATSWDVSRFPGGVLVGRVATATSTSFKVTKPSGTKVGRIVKASTGGWKVYKGDTKVALAKANGSGSYPVNLYNLSGTRIARAGVFNGSWRVEKVISTVGGTVFEIRATVPKTCPGRAAIGAVRIVFWS